jgi:hypothetical protein
MLLELIKEDFPLSNDFDELAYAYTDIHDCAIGKALQRNGFSNNYAVSGFGVISGPHKYYEPTILFHMNIFKQLNDEFIKGRTEPYVLDYPTLRPPKESFLSRIPLLKALVK